MGQVHDLSVLTILVRVLLSIVVGGVIGLERGKKSQAAGFRTYMLVCLGSAMVMMTNQFISIQFNTGDPSRMGAQVISGIGFLGAGTILVTKNNRIKGLTTAAGIWASATIGLAIGIGFYLGAIIGAIFILIIMTVLQPLKSYIQKRSRNLSFYVVFTSLESFNRLLIYFSSIGIKVNDIQNGLIDIDTLYQANHENGEMGCYFTIKLSENFDHIKFIEEVHQQPGVKYVEEIK
ncbi:MgtC/SapB family protein [Enterococcus cecorum]|uniref:MgtC/SapB family protein n=1 Tax=Enterococcus cecorum TaxID=44008 RepID=UPI0022D988C7|nr:MgtC/SapB family protein [Enterococcus cecorum]MDZ5440725.1 MgtC/SapB family protein [Enterococcus cecorum]MDZ5497739.1 MgtC/SapB family protein [Enterococcus cecorum]MDZ5499873.1 MgtC/SapB family protein [Enterococcus cecorum]MDZ5562689.1 MgtC/SapB family protein [Enterococcus cecorum]MDZ5600127.1 MgtC/SapB family protein [Enterococcus cecorum]